MPEIEIVDNLFKPQENPHEDRITAILQKRAQPQSYNSSQINSATEAAQYSALAGRSGNGVEQILDAVIRKPQQEQMNMEYESARGLYDMFEEKRARGDKQAQALFDKIALFTGGDPEGTALFVEALHADPENIDPGNAYQVMTKLAGIARKTGYKPLDVRAKEAQINASNALASNRSSGGGKVGGTGVERMRDWYIEQGVPPLEAASLAQKSAGMGNTYIPGQGIVPIANSKSLDTLDQSIAAIDQVITSPGLEARTGYSSMISPKMQGYQATSAQARIDQLKGMGFLDAYNALKGGGQITEVEGEKATQARIRLEQATSQDDFVDALKEWQDIQIQIRDRMRSQLDGINPPSGTDLPGQEEDPLGIR